MDLATLVKGIIALLFAAGLIALVCYIIIRIMRKFFGGTGDWEWFVWCIGGLLWILAVIKVFDINVGLW
jgi:formate hydrogenlyase subunit 3/multisubunit Na+/H+ antiporter MnhD subunit